jgi:hypothetical protein
MVCGWVKMALWITPKKFLHVFFGCHPRQSENMWYTPISNFKWENDAKLRDEPESENL